MKLPTVFFIAMALSSCALTSPEGKNELIEDTLRDRHQLQSRRDLIGEPVFVKVRAYSKIQDGHIFGPAWILMQVKRKPLDLQKLSRSLEEGS